MTTIESDTGSPLRPADRLSLDTPVIQRLADRLGELAPDLLHHATAAIPFGAALPKDHFDSEVVPAIASGILMYLRAVGAGTTVDMPEIHRVVDPVVERHVADGLPLSGMVWAFMHGVQRLWDVACSVSGTEDFDDLVAIGHDLFGTVGLVAVATIDTYLDEEPAPMVQLRADRNALCAALLVGSPADDLARAVGIPLADAYRVVALQADSGTAPQTSTDALVVRRRARWARSEFEASGGANWLSSFDGSRGILLQPSGDDVESLASTITSRLADRFSATVIAADHAAVPRERIPGVAAECADLADLAWRLGRPSGTYRLEDMLLEYQLTRPGTARTLLAEQIEPLRAHPHLLDALRAHIAHGDDRKAAAARLHVHPNTFSYRLRRVAELTGIDPTTPDGSRLLAAALTVDDIVGPR